MCGYCLVLGDQDPAPDIPRAMAVSVVALQLRSGVCFCKQSAVLSLHNVPWFCRGAVSEHDLIHFRFN